MYGQSQYSPCLYGASLDGVGDITLRMQTHCDIIEDFTMEFTDELVRLSKELDFVIFEDRKFADIGEFLCFAVPLWILAI